MSRFYTILTRVGIAKILNATLTNQKVDITHMAIGDVAHTPNQDATSLPSEVWRGPVHLVEIDATNPNWLNIESAIPSTVGGFTARSLALYDSAGDVLAVGTLPESYKPIMEEGSSKDLYVRSIIEVSNASVINIKADPSAIIANRKYVDDKFQIISTNLSTLQQQLTTHLVESELKHSTAPLSIAFFEIASDGSITETTKLQAAIDYCYENGLQLDLGSYTIRTDSIILKCNMDGTKATVLFNEGHNFTNFESDGSRLYAITHLGRGITFESDKERYWNSVDAGNSYVEGILKADVRRKYGQRVYIGNKTTTPNNILAADAVNQQNGRGFWNKDYSQWNSESGLNLNDLSETYGLLPNKNDTNILSLTNAPSTIQSAFIGFCIGLTIKGGYDVDLTRASFKRCKVGLVTEDAATLPGVLSDRTAKCTTINIHKCLFEDISYFGHYGYSFLQGYIDDNIFQPCKVAQVLLYASDNVVQKNYHEICYIGTYIGTNDATKNVVDNNFNNAAYNKYAVYARYGVSNKFLNAKGKKNAYAAAAISNCDFDNTFTLTKDNAYFYANGNSVDRNKTKYCIFSVTGVGGTAITRTLIESNRDALISSIVSNGGLFFNGKEEILNVEYMTDTAHLFVGYFDMPTGSKKHIYIDRINLSASPPVFTRGDFRTDGQTVTIKVTFNDGYTS